MYVTCSVNYFRLNKSLMVLLPGIPYLAVAKTNRGPRKSDFAIVTAVPTALQRARRI